VPKLIDVGEHKGRPFLVTPYVGRDLTETDLPSDAPSALALFHQAVAGVAAGHEAGLIHRDVKPNNIVVDSEGVVSVVDFGICGDAAEGEVILTTMDEGFGNRAFAAPECEPGSVDTASPASDVYSLGKLLYWQLTRGVLVMRESVDADRLQLDDALQRSWCGHLLRHTIVEAAHARWSVSELLDGIDWVIAKLDEQARFLPHRVVVDGFDPELGHPRSGSRSATMPPEGNPPADGDLGQRLSPTRDGSTVSIEVAVIARSGDGLLDVALLPDDGGRPGSTALAHWQVGLPMGTDQILRIEPEPPVTLVAGHAYWLTLSTPNQGGHIAWWSATSRVAFIRTSIAERYDTAPWQVAETNGAGYALRVILDS
jgi:Protein kinase domain